MKTTIGKDTLEKKLAVFFASLPLSFLAGMAAFSLILVVLLLLNQFKAELIWTVGLVPSLLVGVFAHSVNAKYVEPLSRLSLIVDIGIFCFIVFWGLFNIFYTSEHIITNRDPGVYATSAAWLSTHDSLIIKDAGEISPDVKGVSVGSMGYWSYQSTGGQIYAQGQHLLPALLGALGKIFGALSSLHFSVLFGMTALLALYAFSRQVLKPHFAPLPPLVMGASLPLLYFSRDTYTEPLALTFIFGGLAYMWLAQKSHNIWLWALAGSVVGAGSLVRVDAYLPLIGIAAFFGLYIGLAGLNKKTTRRSIREFGVFLGALAVPSVVGTLDLMWLSPHYFGDIGYLIAQELMAMLAAFIVTLLFVRKTIKSKLLTKKFRFFQPALAIYIGVGVVLAMALLTSRFLWMQGKNPTSPLFGGRSYAEISTYWNEWYLGSAVMVLGIIGLAIMLHRVISSQKMLLMTSFVLVLAVTSVIYFLKPSIFPDQIWASRRMLPVVMPGIAVAAAFAMQYIVSKIEPSIPARGARSVAILSVMILLVLTPLQVSSHFLKIADSVQYSYISKVCDKTPIGSSTLLWVGAGGRNALQASRTFCGVQAYGFEKVPSKETLANIAKQLKSKGKTPLVAINTYELNLISDGSQSAFVQVGSMTYNRVQSLLNGPPKSSEVVVSGVSMAGVNRDGTIVPLD